MGEAEASHGSEKGMDGTDNIEIDICLSHLWMFCM
jgi:hypothetical protein